MEQVYKNKNCSGCSACKFVCPTNAIDMKQDSKGFSYPVIDSGKCSNCNICIETCPTANGFERNTLGTCYAAQLTDSNALRLSSSGGIAYALARYITENGGVAYGAAYENDMRVKHIRIDSPDDLYLLQGSKYVQSDMTDIYVEIKKDLVLGKNVLFTGTPCQIAGVNAAFDIIKYPNLYTISIICHGVPSPTVWGKYVSEELKLPCVVNMRDKVSGWQHSSFSIKQKRGIKVTAGNKNSFLRAFINNLSLRDICYTCPFKGEKRLGDLTLGDCWGHENLLPVSRFDNNGLSVVFPNTQRGLELFDRIREKLDVEEIDCEQAVQNNLMLVKSIIQPSNRDAFFNDFNCKSLKRTVYKYIPDDPFILKIKKKLYPLKQWLLSFGSSYK